MWGNAFIGERWELLRRGSGVLGKDIFESRSVIARPMTLRKSSASPLAGRTASQAFNAAVVSFHKGNTRSRRPLSMTWMLVTV